MPAGPGECTSGVWGGSAGSEPRRRLDGPVQVLNDRLDGLRADREANEFRREAACLLFLRGELLVGRARGVDDKRLRVTDVREQAGEFDLVAQLAAGLVALGFPEIVRPLHSPCNEHVGTSDERQGIP